MKILNWVCKAIRVKHTPQGSLQYDLPNVGGSSVCRSCAPPAESASSISQGTLQDEEPAHNGSQLLVASGWVLRRAEPAGTIAIRLKIPTFAKRLPGIQYFRVLIERLLAPKRNSLCCLLAFALLLSSAQAADRPNVIFVLADDLGYSDIGCYGAKKVETPHLDQLAAEGIRFTDFHTAASICSPSRAAFLTGAYPQRAGLYMGINPQRDAHWFLGLNPKEITIAEQFRKQGYKTSMIGKWHLGTEPEFHMLKQGFDEYYGMPCNFHHSPKFFDGEKEVFAKTPLEQLTTLYTERVKQIIKRNAAAKSPFFLYYAHNYPHMPYKSGPKFKGSSKDGVRGDVIQEFDWGIGEMMKALKEAGIAENTIVIFSSDNGPTKNEYAKPYRGTKFVSFEGGHRVPFIFHWPALVKKGAVSSAKINAMDLFPTLSEIIKAPMPTDRVYDGVSILPALSGKALSRPDTKPFFYYNCENLQAIRYGNWKLHLPRKAEQVPFWEKNKGFFKLTAPVLYNLAKDESESTDVAAQHPELVKQMLGIAQEARAELGEYMQRGKGQRPTGSIFNDVPIISHMKDWGTVDEALRQEVMAERRKRYPNYKPRGTKKKKRKKR